MVIVRLICKMNDPETALKNAVFEYLLATNNVKSAEVFFKESNLQSNYDVSVDVMVHNTQVYGNSCLICKLFNNWYTFAHNQRLITPQPSVLLHANHKDENMQHMQQFLQFYHTHDKNDDTTKCSPMETNDTNEQHTHNNFPLPSSPNSPLHHFPTSSSSTPTALSPTLTTTPTTTTTTTNPITTFNLTPNFVAPAPPVLPNSPNSVQSPPSNSDSIASPPAEDFCDKSSETIAKENEFLFSVERKLFNTLENQPPETTLSNSDTLIHLLNLNPLPLPSSPTTPQPNIYSPSSSRPHTAPSQITATTTIATEELIGKDENIDFGDFEANIEKYNQAGRFCCPYPNCTKSFSTSAILKRHIKEHSGDRPYKCTFEGCGKGFARNYDLKVHMRSHTGEKPYRCTFMGCERTFTRSSDLRLHERIHKGEKPFVCDCAGCQKRFVRYADLKKHKRTHEVHEGHHPHVHGAGCGHTAIAHEDHIDYLHDAHLHNHHKDHIDDHKIGLSESNPINCTHAHHTTFTCDPTHTHNATCGHELVPHYDHYDYLVDGHLHFVHEEHCDDHGWIDVVTWNPSDFPTPDGIGGVGTGTSTYGHEDDSSG